MSFPKIEIKHTIESPGYPLRLVVVESPASLALSVDEASDAIDAEGTSTETNRKRVGLWCDFLVAVTRSVFVDGKEYAGAPDAAWFRDNVPVSRLGQLYVAARSAGIPKRTPSPIGDDTPT